MFSRVECRRCSTLQEGLTAALKSILKDKEIDLLADLCDGNREGEFNFNTIPLLAERAAYESDEAKSNEGGADVPVTGCAEVTQPAPAASDDAAASGAAASTKRILEFLNVSLPEQEAPHDDNMFDDAEFDDVPDDEAPSITGEPRKSNRKKPQKPSGGAPSSGTKRPNPNAKQVQQPQKRKPGGQAGVKRGPYNKDKNNSLMKGGNVTLPPRENSAAESDKLQKLDFKIQSEYW